MNSYSEIIADGGSFSDYVQRCGRAFLVELRDSNWDTPLPKRIPLDVKYHVGEANKAKLKLAAVRKMSPKRCDVEATKEFELIQKRYRESIAKREKLAEKYQAILPMIDRFESKLHSENTGLTPLVEFLRKNIEESLDFDCRVMSYNPNLMKISGQEWKKERIKSLTFDVKYHSREIANRKARNKETNRWLKELHETLNKLAD